MGLQKDIEQDVKDASKKRSRKEKEDKPQFSGSILPNRIWEPIGTLSDGTSTWVSRERPEK